MTGDEKFFAWLDGELEGAEAAEMAARVEADPQLSALAEQHRARLAGFGGLVPCGGDVVLGGRGVADPAGRTDAADGPARRETSRPS